MESPVENVVLLRFDAIAGAREAIRALHRLHESGDVTLAAASVVGRKEDGRAFALEQAVDDQPSVGSAFPGDNLVRLLSGPFGVVLHNAPDALVGSLVDIADFERSERLLRCFGDHVPPGSIVTIALLSETAPAAVDALSSSVGGVLIRKRREDVELEIVGGEKWIRQPPTQRGGLRQWLALIMASLPRQRWRTYR